MAHNAVFADYYRVALYPTDSVCHKEFKDFYSSGELRKEGYFLSIDSLNDSKTIFDGEVRSYFRNSNISEKSHYANGRLHGEYTCYNEEGKPLIHAFYRSGELSGTYKTYNGDGSCKIIEYDAGQLVHDYYLLTDGHGNAQRFQIADDRPIWESPSIAERFVDYRDGTPWEVYSKNGVTIALTNSVVKDYGKWHRIDLVISNNSTSPIEFMPEQNIVAYSVDNQGTITGLKIWTCDAYMKKVKRSQSWAAIAAGFCEGLVSGGAGYSTSTTTGFSSNGVVTTYYTTTYNAASANQARLASQQRLSELNQAMQKEKEIKQIGYMKKNTIYPGESISGYVHVARIKGEKVVFIIDIEGAKYIYEWRFDKKAAYLN